MAPENDFAFANKLDSAKPLSEQTAQYINIYSEIVQKIRQFLPKDTLFVRFDCPLEFLSIEEKDAFEKSMESVFTRAGVPVFNLNVLKPKSLNDCDRFFVVF